jgi:type II secretory ATPase GspE/PulE/Tfp pilus assembly ATPase PilB-like protein
MTSLGRTDINLDLTDDFVWPGPPYAAYRNSGETGAAQECEVEGLNGTVRACLITGMDPLGQKVYLEVPPVKKAFGVSFSQIRKVSLRQTVRPQVNFENSTGAINDLINHRPTMEFEVQMSDGTQLSGSTVGHVEDEGGVFLFPPVDNEGTLQRIFVPRTAYSSLKIGSPIGHVLVEQKLVTASQIEETARVQKKRRSRKLGDYLVHTQVVSATQLLDALDQQSRMPMVRTGEALIALGMISEEQLTLALKSQKYERNVPLGELLVKEGLVSREDLRSALARKLGYPVVDVSNFPVEEAALSRVPFALARRLNFLPLVFRNGVLAIAIENPTNHVVMKEIEYVVQAKVAPALGEPVKIMNALISAYRRSDHYADRDEIGSGLTSSSGLMEFDAAEVSQLVNSLERQHQSQVKEESEAERTIDLSDNSLVKLINTMIVDAHSKGVSDIHIETHPGNHKVRVRFRKDGVLSPYLDLPPTYRSAMISRIKVMCELDISERRLPQDGKIEFVKFSPQHKLELRVATIPTAGGLEDVVMRLLSSAKPLPMDKLNLSDANFRRLRDVVERPYGMVLCVGPTGSGKTTTLHSVLGQLNRPERKIWTAEDPVEITQPDLRQVQVNAKIGWTFAKALRSFLRADPDIIMVGEIRDQETAQMAIEASLTGHLVLSTLHTNSAPETVTRLLDMGMDPFNFGDSLLAVLAQRLIRCLCSECRISSSMSPEMLEELLDDYLHAYPADIRPDREVLRAEWGERFGTAGALQHVHAPGCPHCDGTGLAGRIGVHELMTITPELRRLIQTGSEPAKLLHEAMAHGQLHTLRQDGIEKVLAGLTSLQEVRANCN